jgi:hypothetical protein
MDIVLGITLFTAAPFLCGFFGYLGYQAGILAIFFGKQLVEKYL